MNNKPLIILVLILFALLLLSLAHLSSQQTQPANTGSVPITELFCTHVVDCEKYSSIINKSVNYTETNLNKVAGQINGSVIQKDVEVFSR